MEFSIGGGDIGCFGRSACMGTNFTKADLRGAKLEMPRLTGADFSGANLLGATFFNVKRSDLILEGAQFDEDSIK